MPLFGNKDKHHTTEPVGHSTLNPATGPGTGVGVGHGTNTYGTDTGAMNTGTGLHHGTHHGAGNVAGVGSGYNNEPGYGSAAGMPQHHGAGAGTAGFGAGAGAGTGLAGQHHTQPMTGATDIPPSGALNTSDQSRHGQGGSMSGKVERTIGNLVGSQSLKAKGAEKEAEARAINQQGAELSEAERLEGEAKMRRERAVGHGAHPDNLNIGNGIGTNQMRGSGWS